MTTIGESYWDKWWMTDDFCLNCSSKEYDINGKLIKCKRWEDDIREALERKAIDEWTQALTRQEAKWGKGGNKLRTYALLKKESAWGMETYLSQIEDNRKRILLLN